MLTVDIIVTLILTVYSFYNKIITNATKAVLQHSMSKHAINGTEAFLRPSLKPGNVRALSGTANQTPFARYHD